MSRFGRELQKSNRKTIHAEERWLAGIPGIVAINEDPERQHRIQVVIPSIDENIVRPEWVRPLAFCLGNGFGVVFIPPLETEVALFGVLGEKHNLFYASLYSEEMLIPEDFDETVSGFRAPGDVKIISEGDMLLRSGRCTIEADGSIHFECKGGVFVNGKKIG